MTGYVTSGRLMRDHYRDSALEARRFARWCLRQGDRYGHHQFMHDAVRAWRNFKHYQRMLGNG